MERKFEILSGQALKVPVLRILYEGADLNQKVISVKAEGSVIHLRDIQLQNTGNRVTEFVSVRLQFAAKVDVAAALWESTPTSDKDFPSVAFTAVQFRISPQETWNLTPLTVVAPGVWPSEVRAKMHAFYGQERPAEAVFVVRIAQK